jgi:cobalt-precorrin-5B (C1)-methyltransferase
LAGGIMNTHSSMADCRLEIIAAHSALVGADQELIRLIMLSATTEAAIDLLIATKINQQVWQSIGQRIAYHLTARTKGCLAIDFTVFTQEHGILVKGSIERTETVQFSNMDKQED